MGFQHFKKRWRQTIDTLFNNWIFRDSDPFRDVTFHISGRLLDFISGLCICIELSRIFSSELSLCLSDSL